MAQNYEISEAPLILIVDDIQENIQIMANTLSEEGYQIAFAMQGEQSLEIVRDIRPDIILLDIVMPGMDGYEVCRRLKENAETKSVPVIFITAKKTGSEDIIKGFHLGAADYVTKPFNSAELSARVRTHLNLKFQTEHLRQSEMRYRAVVEDQTELIFRFYPNGILSFVNDACCRFFEKHRKELIGKKWLTLIPKKDRCKIQKHIVSLNKANPVSTIEHRLINGKGEIRYQGSTYRAIFDDLGNIGEIQSVVRDISDRIYAEEAYHSLVDFSPHGLAILQDQRIVFANARMNEITGYTHSELLALSPEEVNSKLHPAGWESHFEKGREYAVSSGKQTRIVRKDGDIRWVEIYARNVQYHGKPSLQITLVDNTRVVELETLLGERTVFENIIGQSKSMQRVYTLIEQFADTENTLLITGETGTGKELVMEALHKLSSRSGKPLIRVNCAALSENILESELFGHVKGAFTGAVQDKIGRFQAAEGGTLFLDEIGELGLHLQVKLLRVLEQKEFESVGSSRTIRSDIRILAATNADMKAQVLKGAFREDLYFRLNVFSIRIPPLRDRKDDIPLLMNHFMKSCANAQKKQFTGYTDELLKTFMNYSWPGNVRQLKGVIEYACTVCPEGAIKNIHLPQDFSMEFGKDEKSEQNESFEREKIMEILIKTDWNKAKTARMLGISRATLYNKLVKFDIDSES